MADGGDYEAERQQRIARNRQAMEVRRRPRHGTRNWGDAAAARAPCIATLGAPRRSPERAAAAHGRRKMRRATHPE
jgi:hypothetical protein